MAYFIRHGYQPDSDIKPNPPTTQSNKPYRYTKLEITLLEEIQDARQEGLSEQEIIKTLERILYGLNQ